MMRLRSLVSAFVAVTLCVCSGGSANAAISVVSFLHDYKHIYHCSLSGCATNADGSVTCNIDIIAVVKGEFRRGQQTVTVPKEMVKHAPLSAGRQYLYGVYMERDYNLEYTWSELHGPLEQPDAVCAFARDVLAAAYPIRDSAAFATALLRHASSQSSSVRTESSKILCLLVTEGFVQYAGPDEGWLSPVHEELAGRVVRASESPHDVGGAIAVLGKMRARSHWDAVEKHLRRFQSDPTQAMGMWSAILKFMAWCNTGDLESAARWGLQRWGMSPPMSYIASHTAYAITEWQDPRAGTLAIDCLDEIAAKSDRGDIHGPFVVDLLRLGVRWKDERVKASALEWAKNRVVPAEGAFEAFVDSAGSIDSETVLQFLKYMNNSIPEDVLAKLPKKLGRAGLDVVREVWRQAHDSRIKEAALRVLQENQED